MRPIKNHERGYSLIVAVSVVALLSMVGIMVLDQVYTDTQLSGGDRAALNAMYLAEAGAVWGKQALVDLLYPPGTNSGTANVANLTVLSSLGGTDVLCPENNCTTQPCPAAITCTNWYLLTNTSWVPYGNGQYRVAATCNPNCLVTNPISYSVRALGQSFDGSQRLLEVTVGQ